MKYRIVEFKVSKHSNPMFYIEKKVLFGLWISAHNSSHQGGGFGPTPFYSYWEALQAINNDINPVVSEVKYHYI